MKTITRIITIIMAAVAVMLYGCKADEPGTSPVPADPTEVELPRINSFKDIVTDGAGSWVVTENPEWAGPMAKTGEAGENVRIFVETNFDEEDRRGSMKLRYSDGSETEYVLMQHGTLSDDENGEILSKDNIAMTYGVGFPVNVLMPSQNSKYAMNSTSPLKFEKLIAAFDALGEPDAFMAEDRYYSRVESLTGSSTSAISNQLAVNAGIEVGLSAFKLSVEGGFSQEKNQNSSYEYAIEEIQHIVGSRQMRGGMLRYLATEPGADSVFSTTFKKYRKQLADNPDDVATMERIISDYGTHIVTQASVGGELKLSMRMEKQSGLASSDIRAALDLGTKVVNGGGEFHMSDKDSLVSTNTQISLETYGGDNVYTISPVTSFGAFHAQVRALKNLQNWSDPIKNGESVSVIDIEVIPICDLLATEASRTALRNYIAGTYQAQVFAGSPDYKGPDLYMLKGFDNAPDHDNEASVYIPEIDVEVVASRSIVPGLSGKEYSTVIYSGSKGRVNKTRGFFIGSATRRPCKFWLNADGTYKTEEFDLLKPGMVGELYVDMTGDITLYPKTTADFYRTVEFTDWKYREIDLLHVSGNQLVIENTVKVSGRGPSIDFVLRPDATLILDGVTTTGTISCEGNAEIVLNAGSRNTFRTDSRRTAIKIGPTRTTLTLSGDGQLTVDRSGTCIGTDGTYTGGNIEIKGGDYTLQSFNGPAIGSNDSSECGDITVSGGRVRATTHSNSTAAIGTASSSKCGHIRIGRGITSLTATCVDALECIGRGGVNAKRGMIFIDDEGKVFTIFTGYE